jgi:hypothetical protein
MDPTMKRLLMQQVAISEISSRLQQPSQASSWSLSSMQLPFPTVSLSHSLLLHFHRHHQVHRFLSSAFSSSISSARPLHASTKTDITEALQRVLALIVEHRK